EIRAALLDLLGACGGTVRIVASVLPVKSWIEPVGGPFPDVAGHVVQSVAIGREGVHGAGSVVAVGAGVFGREGALPDVHSVLAARLALVAPGEDPAIEPAAGRELPLGLSRQAPVRPGAIRLSVVPGDM